MYGLGTVAQCTGSQTDRQTDGRQCHAKCQ